MASTISKTAAKDKKKSESSYFEDSEMQSQDGSVRTEWSDESPVRSLRKRTMRQEHPYRTDKVEHNLAKKGLKTSKSDLEERVQDVMRTKVKKDSVEPRKKKQRILDSSTASTKSELIAAKVIARTWFSKVTSAHIPVKLNMASTSELFDKLEESWHSVLEDQRIKHCIASFSWLDEDANILLLRVDDGTAFAELIREAKHRPVGKDQKHSVSIHISV